MRTFGVVRKAPPPLLSSTKVIAHAKFACTQSEFAVPASKHSCYYRCPVRPLSVWVWIGLAVRMRGAEPCGDNFMPIIRLLEREHHAFGPEEIKILTAAFERALRTLRLAGRTDPATDIVARRIIEFARLGELDPVRLHDYAIEINQPCKPE